MSTEALAQSPVEMTANDRFKDSFGSWFWGSLVVATLLHFAIFAFFPAMTAADYSFSAEEIATLDLPPEIEIPPPPEQIARPATPVVAAADIDQDITIAPTTFEDNPIENLPPPPAAGQGSLMDQPVFTPYTVAPELRNRAEVQRALVRFYPPLLRDAGIGGQVLVWFFIDEHGKVQNTRLRESSGHTALDEAAMRVAEIMEFRPAVNRDRNVPVWVALPITFSAR